MPPCSASKLSSMLRPSDIPWGLDGSERYDTTSLDALTGALGQIDL